MIVALIGPHGVGKTTLGARLAARLGWACHDELGRRLRDEALAADPTAHAMTSGPAFDLAVFEGELARDRTAEGPRVVETWHPGNFAYARLRSPELATRWEARLAQAARGAWVIPLVAEPEHLTLRQSEEGPPELATFFARVAREAEDVARTWGCRVCTPVRTDCAIEDSLADLLSRLP